jgi:hypothetical protein
MEKKEIESTEANTNWKQLVLEKLKKELGTEYQAFVNCKLNNKTLLVVISSRTPDAENYLYEALIFLMRQQPEIAMRFVESENIDVAFQPFLSKAIGFCRKLIPKQYRPKHTQFSTIKVIWIN